MQKGLSTSTDDVPRWLYWLFSQFEANYGRGWTARHSSQDVWKITQHKWAECLQRFAAEDLREAVKLCEKRIKNVHELNLSVFMDYCFEAEKYRKEIDRAKTAKIHYITDADRNRAQSAMQNIQKILAKKIPC